MNLHWAVTRLVLFYYLFIHPLSSSAAASASLTRLLKHRQWHPRSILKTSTEQSSASTSLSSTSLQVAGPTSAISQSEVTISTTSQSSDGYATPATTTTATWSQWSQTIDAATDADIHTIQERRVSFIIEEVTGVSSISSWLQTLDANGKWPDSEIDYTTGCPARRANWPAQKHWERILTMSAAWHGGTGIASAEKFVKDPQLRASISTAMEYWFSQDFTNAACIDSGGTPSCPCGTPGLWNTNWFCSVILIPNLVAQSCLILNDTLSAAHVGNCTHMTGRAYGTFDHSINGAGFLTGANTLDVASIGLDQALLTTNVSMVTDAYRRVHKEVTINNNVTGDGIRADGSFGQHGGILYNGNYGKDYLNDALVFENAAIGTQFTASSDSRNAIATLVEGDRWAIYRNIVTQIAHWDYSVLGRFISFPTVDPQGPTKGLAINLTQVSLLGQAWNIPALTEAAEKLSENTTNANAGELVGNRMFYTNDYMVHRGQNYVTTVKMFSSRSKNTECTNTQNPLGFHLSDGSVHTYLKGNEYEDIAVAWDWNLIPGTTTDYAATALDCSDTQFTGVEAFVGGVSTGETGIAAMRYTNPLTGSLHFQKTWFFLQDDVQHVMVANISSSTNAPIYSILDQRLHSGDVIVDERPVTSFNGTANSVWHGDIGYVFSQPDIEESTNSSQASKRSTVLSIQTGLKTGNWSAIGTSVQPLATVDLFTAWLTHKSVKQPISYTALPGLTLKGFRHKQGKLRLETLQNNENVSALFDHRTNTLYAVFFNIQGGIVKLPDLVKDERLSLLSNGNSAIVYCLNTGNITVSDPSQTRTDLTLTLKKQKRGHNHSSNRTLDFILPSGGLAGSSISLSTS